MYLLLLLLLSVLDRNKNLYLLPIFYDILNISCTILKFLWAVKP